MDQSNQSIFVVESCQNCKAHQWHTGHDEQKYIEYFNKISAAIKERVPSAVVLRNEVPREYVPFDLYCNLSYNSDPNCASYQQLPRTGAFEVSFKGHLIFSKLQCGQWPSGEIMGSKAEGIVNADKHGEDVTPYTVAGAAGAKGSPRRGNVSPKRNRSPSPQKAPFAAAGSSSSIKASHSKKDSLVQSSQQEAPVIPFKPDDKDQLVESGGVVPKSDEKPVEEKPKAPVEEKPKAPVEEKPAPVQEKVEDVSETVVEVEKDPVYEAVEYKDEHKSAGVAIQKALEVLALPVTLKTHHDKLLRFDGKEGQECVGDQHELVSNAVWVIFPLDDGMICLKHNDTQMNLQMIQPHRDGLCCLHNANQLDFERMLLEWSDEIQQYFIECPHHTRTIQVTPSGVVKGDNNNRLEYEKWRIQSVPNAPGFKGLEIDIHEVTSGLQSMKIAAQ